MKLYIIAGLIVIVTSCVTTNEEKGVIQNGNPFDRIEKTEMAPSIKFDSPKKIQDFITEFVQEDFYRTHKELVDKGKGNYQFTEIEYKEKFNMIQYSFEIPGVEGDQVYSCFPYEGKTETVISGDSDVTQLYFEGLEKSKKWDRNGTESGHIRVLELTEKWNDYPVTTHMLVKNIVFSNMSVLTITRRLIPN